MQLMHEMISPVEYRYQHLKSYRGIYLIRETATRNKHGIRSQYAIDPHYHPSNHLPLTLANLFQAVYVPRLPEIEAPQGIILEVLRSLRTAQFLAAPLSL